MRSLLGSLIILVLFILAFILSIMDPFNFNPEGINGDSWLPALYLIPIVIAFKLLYKKLNRNGNRI